MAKHTIEPRGLTLEDALYYVGVSVAWFQKRKTMLEKDYGFPKKHPITGKYDRQALDRWYDQTGGLVEKSVEIREEEELIERARSGKY